MLPKLNELFGLGDALRFESGENGLTRAVLRHDSGASLEVYLHGAHVTKFHSPEFGEVLYLSPKTEYQPGKAIRGGIPVIFPQFGPGPLPSHGFARNTEWTVFATSKGRHGETIIIFELNASEQTKKIWGYKFRCELEIRLSASLATVMRVENIGDSPLSFQTAFHTYYRVGDAAKVTVSPFNGLTYLDNLNARSRENESRTTIAIDGEVDRIYLKAPNQIHLDDASLGRRILLKKQNLPDSVLWNPWIEKGASLKDLEENGYKKFVCIEAGSIEPEIEINPGATWEGGQEIWLLKL